MVQLIGIRQELQLGAISRGKGLALRKRLPRLQNLSLRVLLTMVSLEDLEGEQADNCDCFSMWELDETVYMRIPGGLIG